jgi:dolichol-phosphate mannosyltransferase
MISVVIPVYNEESLIDSLYKKIMDSLILFTHDFEVICIDDGSTDQTLVKLLNHHQKDKRFKIITLSRNFGHQAAYTAGLCHAKGDYIVMIDGDLQDPPALIQEMYNKIKNEDFDVVFGKRTEREEGLIKQTFIKIFHQIFTRLSNVKAPANVGNFSIMTRQALNSFLELKEKNRYLPGLRFFIGFKQGFVDYSRSERESGMAKMNFKRLFKLALDALFSFSKLPIQICLLLGIIGILFSLSGGSVVIYKKITGVAITGWTSVMLSIYFLGSVQLLFMGILGEYIHRIFIETQNRPIYIVKKVYE